MTADDSQLVIERSFYEALRLELVDKGLTPDITTFQETEDGYQAYESAIQSLKTTQGYAVELFGTSAQVNRGILDTSRIIIESITYVPGDFGIDSNPVVQEAAAPYTETVPHNLSFKFYVDVIISTDLKHVEREMVKAVHSALNLRGLLKQYNNEDLFFIEMVATRDESMLQKGLLRKKFSFEVPDVVFYEDTVNGPVAAMTEYTLNIEIIKYLGIN